MKQKQRPSYQKKRFNIFDRLRGVHRLHLTDENVGDIGLVAEPGDGSFGTYNCSTLVLQAIPHGTKADREKPISIFWHIHPRVFNPDERTLAAKETKNRQPTIPGNQLLSVTGSLRGDASLSFEPKELVGNMLEYLESHKQPDARVRATIIPGANTQDTHHQRHKESMDAVRQTKELLQAFKDDGRIHNIRTRGFSPHAKTKGALHVWIDPNGTIHRIKPPNNH